LKNSPINTFISTAIVFKTHGKRHGPSLAVVSPGEVRQLIKPFVFLDYIEVDPGDAPNYVFHPNSGIAMLTFPITFGVEHQIGKFTMFKLVAKNG
jgi:hypothetical protein